ncbi:glycosyltransferase family 4 protein [Salinigranum marinum]|uniref:glycosyltransferase family 4 protein n=1 Tax=Salinigranum marinum TaxID=1515595 RepID=UPI002989D294|nr:glycosyltransferase family 4 protein [Salinigranum marinum]
MTVAFLPDNRSGNPYQTNLAESLSESVVFDTGDRFLPIHKTVRENQNVSIVHFHWLTPYILEESLFKTVGRILLTFLQLVSLQIRGVKIVWTVHNVMSHQSDHPLLERWFKHVFIRLKICDFMFIHCEKVSEQIVDEYQLADAHIRNRTQVISHGHYISNYENTISATEARNSLGLDPEAIVFLFFGQIRPYKGIPNLIRQFKSFENSSANLLIVGNPVDESIKEEITNQALNDERIKTNFGFIPGDKIQIFMNSADAVVLPYNKITTSGSLILAMSFGRAIIAPRVGCIPELLDERGGLMYGVEDNEGLGNAMREASKRDLDSMGHYNERVVREFSWTEIADKTSEIYSRLLSR